MSVELIREALGWSTLINWLFLVLWFLFFALMRDGMFRLHTRWFRHLSPERFDSIHYLGMALFKMAVLIFNLVPYLALRIIA